MKELIRKVLREEVNRRFVKGTPEVQSFIIKRMEDILSETTKVIPPPEDNYGNYGEEWCKDGNVVLESRYYFYGEDEDENNEKFHGGHLIIDEQVVNFLTNMLQVRKSFIFNVIVEWYDEKYATKFGQETGHPEFDIDEISETDSPRKCHQIIDTSSLSRDEMINYIEKHTLSKKSEIKALTDDELQSDYRKVYNIQLNRK
jgi:hypothetical protein